MARLTPESIMTGHATRLVILVLATILCYLAGLNSLFLFDDAPNLDALAFIQGASPLSPDFWEFVLGGNAGPTGRPVSLFTFALQAQAWPDNPLAFKTVNLLIHCLNAILVYLLSVRLITILQNSASRTRGIALVIALIWALHPVHTSTVLYTVQRMALLSNCFILVGIYLYLAARQKAALSGSPRSLSLLTLAIAVPGLLSLFSKENALSLVFYLLTLEYTLLRDTPTDRPFRQWRYVCLWLPAIMTLLLPLFFFSNLQAEFAQSFTYTAGQRMLTESRILWQYLAALFLPITSDVGIFHDISASNSLFAPVTTLISVIAWLGSLAWLILRPGKHYLLLFALLWYFSGHIIESTILPLELFFHHRNYLAFFGLIVTGVYAFFFWVPDNFLRGNLRMLICCLYLGLLALNTVRISLFWSQPVVLAEQWYDGSPTTKRNVEFYAIQLADLGNEGEQLAALVIAQGIDNHEDSFRLLLDLMTLSCVNPNIIPPATGDVLARAGDLSQDNRGLVAPMQQLATLRINGNCPRYEHEFFETLLNQLIDNTAGYDKGMLQFDLARLKLNQGNRDEALQLLNQAWENSNDPGILFNQALQLINDERYMDALAVIDLAIRETSEHNNIRTGTRRSKLATLNDMRQDVLTFMSDSNN